MIIFLRTFSCIIYYINFFFFCDSIFRLDLLELLNKVLIELDQKNNVNIKEELQETTANRITEFLRVLNYPSNYDL